MAPITVEVDLGPVPPEVGEADAGPPLSLSLLSLSLSISLSLSLSL